MRASSTCEVSHASGQNNFIVTSPSRNASTYFNSRLQAGITGLPAQAKGSKVESPVRRPLESGALLAANVAATWCRTTSGDGRSRVGVREEPVAQRLERPLTGEVAGSNPVRLTNN